MIAIALFFVRMLSDCFKPRSRLEAEIVVLRHQLNVLRLRAPRRLYLRWSDRVLFVWLYRRFPHILDAITIVRPETVVRWHRMGFSAYWRWRSRPLGGRPWVDKQIRDLIRRMNFENPLWGAPKIHGELLKLGIEVAQSTVSKYMAPRRGRPLQTRSCSDSPLAASQMDGVFGSDKAPMLDQVDTAVAMLITFRIMALLVGAFLLFLGYSLFKLGYFEKAGELQAAWGKRRLVLKQVAPGIFFALFGTVIVCVGTWKPISVQSADRTPETVITTLRKVAANQQLTDDERSSIGSWLQQRSQRDINLIANQPPLDRLIVN